MLSLSWARYTHFICACTSIYYLPGTGIPPTILVSRPHRSALDTEPNPNQMKWRILNSNWNLLLILSLVAFPNREQPPQWHRRDEDRGAICRLLRQIEWTRAIGRLKRPGLCVQPDRTSGGPDSTCANFILIDGWRLVGLESPQAE